MLNGGWNTVHTKLYISVHNIPIAGLSVLRSMLQAWFLLDESALSLGFLLRWYMQSVCVFKLQGWV